tara:strand:+ start:168 stop:581 length:414 start_codon:yes stop_codon:yes gene_type:complete
MTDSTNENMELMVRAASIHDKVLANIVKDNKLLHDKVDNLNGEVTYIHNVVQKLTDGQGHITVKALCIIANLRDVDREISKNIGRQLSRLSRNFGYDIKKIPDEIYGTVHSYHPYICKIYLDNNQLPIPPQLQYVNG